MSEKQKNDQQRPEQVSGGVFLIGLALLFFTSFWWPGIMFVIGASMLARTISEGKPLQSNTGAFWVIGIGAFFWLPGLLSFSIGAILPLILIGLGLFMLFGGEYRPDIFNESDKRKNDESDDDTLQV